MTYKMFVPDNEKSILTVSKKRAIDLVVLTNFSICCVLVVIYLLFCAIKYNTNNKKFFKKVYEKTYKKSQKRG